MAGEGEDGIVNEWKRIRLGLQVALYMYTTIGPSCISGPCGERDRGLYTISDPVIPDVMIFLAFNSP